MIQALAQMSSTGVIEFAPPLKSLLHPLTDGEGFTLSLGYFLDCRKAYGRTR